MAMRTSKSRPVSRSVNVETRMGNQARLPELWGAVLRLEPDADHVSGLPGRYQVNPPPSRRGERGQPVEVRKVVEPELEGALETPDIIGLEEAEEAGAETAIEERGARRSRRRRGRDSCRRTTMPS